MSVLTLPFNPLVGPIIRVEIGLPSDDALQRYAVGLSVPPKQSCDALVDTGASVVVVNEDVLNKVGISAYRPGKTHGVGGEEEVQVCQISLSILDENGNLFYGFPSMAAIRPNKPLSIEQQCLIGRSVLSVFEFRYFGRSKKFELLNGY